MARGEIDNYSARALVPIFREIEPPENDVIQTCVKWFLLRQTRQPNMKHPNKGKIQEKV